MSQDSITDVSRRGFLKLTGLGGTALCLGLFSFESGSAVKKTETGTEDSVEMNAWIIIDISGKITLVDHRAEMGQGSYHSVDRKSTRLNSSHWE